MDATKENSEYFNSVGRTGYFCRDGEIGFHEVRGLVEMVEVLLYLRSGYATHSRLEGMGFLLLKLLI